MSGAFTLSPVCSVITLPAPRIVAATAGPCVCGAWRPAQAATSAARATSALILEVVERMRMPSV